MRELSDNEQATAKAIADRIWPIAGDPAFPATRLESDGWMKAYDGASDGIRDRAAGRPSAYSRSGTAYDEAYDAGYSGC